LTPGGPGATLRGRVFSAEMIKTTRRRLEIHQDPDKVASLVGALLVAFGSVEAMSSAATLLAELIVRHDHGRLIASLRLALAVLFAASGWFFLRRRSRVVLDREHHMVARYMGVGGHASGGNRTWDLSDFVEVSLEQRSRRKRWSAASGSVWVVSLWRADGTELELYRSQDLAEADFAAARAADFTGLPLSRG